MSKPVFVKALHLDGRKEVLFNVAHIWKIEVEYVTVGSDGKLHSNLLELGRIDPNTHRIYTVYFGNEVLRCAYDPSSAAYAIIEDIYKNAVGLRNEG